jgi:hypothetical protein
MQVTFYLTEASANTAAGPFNISGTTSGGAANTVEIQTNVSKAVLLTGYTEEIANNITGGTVTSTDGTCNTTDTWSIDEIYTGLVPETSTLSYTFYGGIYDFTLTEALQDDITIIVANVDGFDNDTCSGPSGDAAQIQSPVTITAGQTSASHDSGVGVWPGITYIRPEFSMTLTTYGIKSDGSTFTVPSGTVVTVEIDAICQMYAQ